MNLKDLFLLSIYQPFGVAIMNEVEMTEARRQGFNDGGD